MEKIVASIQVRMGSSRYPGKVMHVVEGKPLLGHLLDRLSFSKRLDAVIVATTTGADNDIIEEYCNSRNTACFRGSEEDVLGRTLGALQNMNATIGVEIFGDCPLIDPQIVDLLISEFLNDDMDFVGNDLSTTFPPGMDVEVFKVSALEDSDLRVQDAIIREHGTLFIRQNPELYRIKNIVAPPQWHRPELEMEMDTVEDMQVISKILKHFQGRSDFTLDEIIFFLDHNPELVALNNTVPRRWKEFREEDV